MGKISLLGSPEGPDVSESAEVLTHTNEGQLVEAASGVLISLLHRKHTHLRHLSVVCRLLYG